MCGEEDEWRYDRRKSDDDKVNIALEGASIEIILAKGFGGKGSEYEEHASRWDRNSTLFSTNAELAQKARTSHLAKAFALRKAPKTVITTDGKNKLTSASIGRGSRPATPTEQPDGRAFGFSVLYSTGDMLLYQAVKSYSTQTADAKTDDYGQE
ncbi:hypothetical protein BDR03DRAFT_983939 [Suillus americanus]|nr:hypothetical protein BDR03DRAFT_983939 [Suillus americanus]